MSDKEEEFYDCVSNLDDANLSEHPHSIVKDELEIREPIMNLVNDHQSNDEVCELSNMLTTLQANDESKQELSLTDASDLTIQEKNNQKAEIGVEKEKNSVNLEGDDANKGETQEDSFDETSRDKYDLEQQEKLKEENLTDEEKMIRQNEAGDLKKKGNLKFKEEKYEEAIEIYTDAITICPKCYKTDLSVLHSNRSVCFMKLNKKEESIKDCSTAIEYNSEYIKPLLRRAQLYESLEKFDESLEDYKCLVVKKPSVPDYNISCQRLANKITQRNEQLKTEMMDKLKDLGNLVLKPFGLSTNNFQMEQNTDSGSYNLKFVNNPGPSTTSNHPNNSSGDS